MEVTSKDPLILLYGDEAFSLAAKEIEELKANSNIPFDNEYMGVGISFMKYKAQQILEGTKKHLKLKTLVSESFGEAAIAKYNR